MQCARRDADDPQAHPRVQEGLVQVAPLERRHAAIFSGFAVEEQVGADQGRANQSRADDELLSEIARVRPRRLVRLLDVVAAKGIWKGSAGFGKRGRQGGFGVDSRAVECADGCRRGGFGNLLESR